MIPLVVNLFVDSVLWCCAIHGSTVEWCYFQNCHGCFVMVFYSIITTHVASYIIIAPGNCHVGIFTRQMMFLAHASVILVFTHDILQP